mmetsp:Transcript_30621/g.71215  ORF Transcript_30621/g.71215 Transcript_30621/m.71215 type:complete len:263 (-) Transcript_30621:108-896(-)|eukprot:CAMPEP_0119356104 /NCGR_PEP_ID=MMETSP1334-20130426/4804_1 /TAXON_ID=127549 /ORGANISM="Calcidiscus leptoporus, Strain RCC1130" /LENGTH=262 /DNA_ID=CAMNT_0007370073 /DNA_START=109 /DNA_END=897 /DNA_ORIENTATION=-
MRALTASIIFALAVCSTLPAVVVGFPTDVKSVFEREGSDHEHVPVKLVLTPALSGCDQRAMQTYVESGKSKGLESCSSLWLTEFDHQFKTLGIEHTADVATMQTLTEALEANTQVASLILDKTDLSADSFVALAEGLAKNKTGLHSLAILSCTLEDVGAEAIARALNTSAIVRLNVAKNKISQVGASALASAYRRLTVFNTIPIADEDLDISSHQIHPVEAAMLRSVISGGTLKKLSLGMHAMNTPLLVALGFEDEDHKEEL